MTVRKSQEERSASTRDKLCKAALQLIAEVGYHNCSTVTISEAAGVSRGAQTHHFPTKFDLVSAAFAYLLNRWETKQDAFLAAHDGQPHANDYTDYLWDEVFNDPYYMAALEIILAARGDARLQQAVSTQLANLSEARLQIWDSVFGRNADVEQTRTLIRMTVCLFRGMSMQHLLEQDQEDYRPRMLDYWKRVLGEGLGDS